MKTLKLLILLFILMLQSQITYSYDVILTDPCPHPGFPTPYYYPQGIVDVKYRLDSSRHTDSKLARLRIYVTQGNHEMLMFDENVLWEIDQTTPIDLQSFPNIAYNEPVRIRVIATSLTYPNLPFIQYGYLIYYNGGAGKKYYSLLNGTAQNTNNGIATFFNSEDCKTLASSNYYVKQYKMTFILNGDFRDSVPVVEPAYSAGWSGELPSHQTRWAYRISLTPTQATFITFVYRVTNILGQDFGFRPVDQAHASVVYYFIHKPFLINVSQFPNPITLNNPVGIFSGNLLQGGEPQCFVWLDSFNIHNFGIERLGDMLKVTANFSGNTISDNNNLLSPPLQLYLQVRNEMGNSEWKRIRPSLDDNQHGCPQLAYILGNDTIKENTILTNSPYENGKDYTDYFVSANPFYQDADSIKFSIVEKTGDVSKIDMLKLNQVLVDKTKEVGVTDAGQVIDYTVTENKNRVTLNDKDDVTDVLNRKDNETQSFKKGDKLSVEFVPEENDEFLIIKMYSNVKNLDIISITTSTGEVKKIKCRSSFSEICVKIERGPFTGFVMSILEDCEVDFVGVVKNHNEHDIIELKLHDAYNKENLGKVISYQDKVYAEVSKGNPAHFIFQNNLNHEKKAFYYLSITGNYKPTGELNKVNKTESEFGFTLSDNNPNPFNPVTNIEYEIPQAGFVTLKVYDISGREIRSLVNDFRAPGNYKVTFEGNDLASGVYFYRLEAGQNTLTKRMILIK